MTKTLTIRFDNEIEYKELPFFRGAIIHLAGIGNTFFHNHSSEGFRYRYPLIQYKRIGGSAAIVCFEQGVEQIGALFKNENLDINLGGKRVCLKVLSLNANQYRMQIWNTEFRYHLRRWLPLNQENYTTYQSIESIAERYTMLEKMLIGNILSMAKGLDIHFEDEVVAKIIEVQSEYTLIYKNIRMQAFDIVFASNVSIPDYAGLGKGASLGYGVVKHIKEMNNN